MPQMRFQLYTFLGSWPWCMALAYVGYVLGERWDSDPRLRDFMHRFDAVILVGLVALLAWYGWRHWRSGCGPGAERGPPIRPATASCRGASPRRTFVGLPLTILASVFVLALIAFGDVTEDVVTADPIVALDTHVDALLAAHRQPVVTSLLLWFTLLGKGQVVAVMALGACALFLLWNRRYYVVPLVLTLGGAEATMQLVKRAVGRARPGADLAYYVERSFSFPSGHATMAAAFYGFLAYAVVQGGLGQGITHGHCLCIAHGDCRDGLSRMYLGVHFLSDVLGGYLVGLMWVAIGIVLAEVMRNRSPVSSLPSHSRRQ